MVCGNRCGHHRIRASQGDRIQAAFSERVASADPPKRQKRPLYHPESNQRNIRVFRASRKVEALTWTEHMQRRRHTSLVEAVDHADGEAGLRVVHRLSVMEAS